MIRHKTIEIITALILLVIVIILILGKIKIKNPDTNNSTERELQEVKVVVKEYLKLEGILYTVENYPKYIEGIKRLTSIEYFKDVYTEDGSHLDILADELVNYRYSIEQVVAEKDKEGYIAMVYGTENIDDISYPYTAIISLTEDKRIKSVWKIPHRF